MSVRKLCLAAAAILAAGALGLSPSAGSAANHSEASALFRSGKIDEAAEIAKAEVDRGVWNRRWSELLLKCQLATGHYEDALEVYDAAVKRYPTSLPLRVIGIEIARFNDLPDRVDLEKAMVNRYLQTGQLRYATSDTLIAAGKFFSREGVDARIVLKNFFDRVLESDPTNLEALIATAELAISKGDFKVASDTITLANRRELEDARLSYLLAKALMSSDSRAATAALQESLKLNPIHAPSLVLKAEIEIDREQYSDAQSTIDSLLEINPSDPLAHALQAVLENLKGDYDAEKTSRAKALERWTTNPNVDHLIGRKLSDKYRFAEGAHYQRLALTFDPDNVPATFQLAQDLLRLGDDDVGWKLAEEANASDPYNVVAFNLMTLKNRMDGFETLRIGEDEEDDPAVAGTVPGDILVRMSPREAKVYGPAVMELLAEAKKTLCKEYDLELDRPVIVEIFPEQNDFAIRTFGLPGGEGFLGVCFGRVVTANSPASQGPRPSNWKSVLWHEFCHVITLTKTNNRMPRWLSEGISVYEERQRDSRWGQSMTAGYREMILGDDLTPIGELSGAFLSPPSPMHLQFAYYQSSLVVEFLIDQYGKEKLNDILDSLASGVAINQAIATHVGSLERLETGFVEYARGLAMEFGQELDFERGELGEDASVAEKVQWAESNPDNYWARMSLARDAFSKKQFLEASKHLEYLVGMQVTSGEQDGILEMLASSYENLGAADKENATLKLLFSISSDALPGLERYIEMQTDKENWGEVQNAAMDALEIQPFAPSIHRAFVRASRQLNQGGKTINSLLAVEILDPIDPAGVKYELARSYVDAGQVEEATEQVVEALLIAPRYRDAHRLLQQLQSMDVKPDSTRSTDEGGESESKNIPDIESTESDATENAKTKSPDSKPTDDGPAVVSEESDSEGPQR